MESLCILKACPHTNSLTQCCCGPPTIFSSFNMATLQSSGRRCLCFSACAKHYEALFCEARPISNAKLSAFASYGAQQRSFRQVVKGASESDVQMQNEVLQKETESESKSVASPIDQNVAELPSAAAEANKQKGAKIEKSWLLRSAIDEGKFQEIISGDGILVGAAPMTDGSSMPLVVDFPMVSSAHARVYGRERRTYQTTIREYFVMDLGSTNGTYLNRSKLRSQTEVKLSRGDTLKFGDERALFIVESQSLEGP